MKSSQFLYHFCFLLFASIVINSCSGIYPEIERGSGYQFQEGFPELRISAIGLLDESDNGIINVAADIVEGSLIYRERENINRAKVELEIRAVGIKGTQHSNTWISELEITSEQSGIVTSQEPILYKRDVEVPPGNYEVHISVIDKASGNRTTRSTETYIPDPNENLVNLTSVQLLSRNLDNDRGYQPVTTYDVSMAKDSIRFLIQVTNNRPENPVVVNSQLIKFEADTSPARPFIYNNPSSMTLDYRGIDYNRRNILDTGSRELEQPGSVMIEYRYPRPERGNYRFEVNVEGAEGESYKKARDFAVKSENYPTVNNSRELAEPLVYLMSRRNHREMMSIEDPDSLKEAVDRFWLSNIGSLNQAKHVITLYYERVEEANKQFSNFKEGWKTDMGMIYILFGPPWFVQRHFGSWRWSYSYDIANPDYHFYFERPRTRREQSFPFEHHILRRDLTNHHVQTMQIQRWLSGVILETNP